jgi:HEAT repeat protein
VAAGARLSELAPELRTLLEMAHRGPALAALEALHRLERLESDVLERGSEHAHADVCTRALALSAGGADALELVRRRLTHPRWEVRRSAARVAGTAAGADELALLGRLAESESDPLVKEALQDAVAAIGARERS